VDETLTTLLSSLYFCCCGRNWFVRVQLVSLRSIVDWWYNYVAYRPAVMRPSHWQRTLHTHCYRSVCPSVCLPVCLCCQVVIKSGHHTKPKMSRRLTNILSYSCELSKLQIFSKPLHEMHLNWSSLRFKIWWHFVRQEAVSLVRTIGEGRRRESVTLETVKGHWSTCPANSLGKDRKQGGPQTAYFHLFMLNWYSLVKS